MSSAQGPTLDDMAEVANVEFLKAALDAHIEALRKSVDRLDYQRTQLEKKLDEARRHLSIYEEALRVAVAGNGNGVSSGDGHRRPSKRQAVMALMSQHPDEAMPFQTIWEMLVERGHVARDSRTRRTLQMTLSTLAKERQVERVRLGVYKLGAPNGDAAQTRPTPTGAVSPREDEDPGPGDTEMADPPGPAALLAAMS